MRGILILIICFYSVISNAEGLPEPDRVYAALLRRCYGALTDPNFMGEAQGYGGTFIPQRANVNGPRTGGLEPLILPMKGDPRSFWVFGGGSVIHYRTSQVPKGPFILRPAILGAVVRGEAFYGRPVVSGGRTLWEISSAENFLPEEREKFREEAKVLEMEQVDVQPVDGSLLKSAPFVQLEREVRDRIRHLERSFAKRKKEFSRLPKGAKNVGLGQALETLRAVEYARMVKAHVGPLEECSQSIRGDMPVSVQLTASHALKNILGARDAGLLRRGLEVSQSAEADALSKVALAEKSGALHGKSRGVRGRKARK